MAVDIAIIVSTFERPDHLERCLASLDAQQDVAGRFEVVVTDDGSRDDTLALVRDLARRTRYPLSYTTHDHDGFRLARCRNEGTAASTAPYLLFTDGDCLLPPDHVLVHLQARRPGFVIGSDCARLDAEASARIHPESIREGRLRWAVPIGERLRLVGKAARAKAYELARIRMRPRLSGNNIAVWRRDLERINGFDEQFVGWGHEDRDLQDRLERSGLRVRSILWRTRPVHLWHPPAPTFARNGTGTLNRRYFATAERPVFCIDGLEKRSVSPRFRPRASARVAPIHDGRAGRLSLDLHPEGRGHEPGDRGGEHRGLHRGLGHPAEHEERRRHDRRREGGEADESGDGLHGDVLSAQARAADRAGAERLESRM